MSEETRAQLLDRWRSAGQAEEAAEFRRVFREETAKAWKAAGRTWTRQELRAASWEAAARAFPPLPMEDMPATDSPSESAPRGRVAGLGDIPADWPELPANASLQAEIGWVQSNRLTIVEEQPGGATVVHLDRAAEPAPSRAALGWLETSIRSYAKYVDVVAKSLKDEVDEEANVRRERMRIEAIRELLQQMHEESDRELLADVPSGIRERTRSCLDDWVRRFKVNLESDARLHLKAHVADLVHRCAEVIANASDEKDATRVNQEPGRVDQ